MVMAPVPICLCPLCLYVLGKSSSTPISFLRTYFLNLSGGIFTVILQKIPKFVPKLSSIPICFLKKCPENLYALEGIVLCAYMFNEFVFYDRGFWHWLF